MKADEIREHTAKQLSDLKQKILGERKEDVMLLVSAMGSSNVVFLLGEIAAQLAELNQKLAGPLTVTMDGGDFLVVRVQS